MNDFLLLWLSLSFSGALATLALILLRPVLRRFSKKWQYYIWLLVILRLLVPVSLDINIVGGLFQQAQTHFTPQYTPAERFSESSDSDLSESPRFSIPENNNPQEFSESASDFFFPEKSYLGCYMAERCNGSFSPKGLWIQAACKNHRKGKRKNHQRAVARRSANSLYCNGRKEKNSCVYQFADSGAHADRYAESHDCSACQSDFTRRTAICFST